MEQAVFKLHLDKGDLEDEGALPEYLLQINATHGAFAFAF